MLVAQKKERRGQKKATAPNSGGKAGNLKTRVFRKRKGVGVSGQVYELLRKSDKEMLWCFKIFLDVSQPTDWTNQSKRSSVFSSEEREGVNNPR